ncbi:MAG: hypothetical protein H6719_15150 [Sandaracinaceae bacterium]|nr:hypothetical protein [Sandaracinaceae bacterium]
MVWGALSIALTFGCQSELTEIVVVVDSDLAVPGELDAVEVSVTGSMVMTASGSLSEQPLPRSVGLVHGGGSLGPITIRAIGTQGGATVTEAVARTSFVRGRTLVLPLVLERRCRGVSCAADQTCAAGACASADVDPTTLADWTGLPDRIDGGVACTPATEACNGMDDDCDDRIDETFDFRTDPSNCGRCGQSCDTIPNASGSCASSVCQLDACDDGFGDCNADATDGCEASLRTATDCGGCGTPCTFPGATGDCATGTCALGACDPGLGDCNADPADGCETALDALPTCGACDGTCAIANGTPSCVMGACAVASCDAGFDDCNGDASDGCETPLNTLTDCGGCGTACSITDGTGSCDTGTCEVASCGAERGDCNMDPSDGCETDTRRSDEHCGMCGNDCTASGTRCRNSVCR